MKTCWRVVATLCIVLIAWACKPQQPNQAVPNQRPNILFLISDDHGAEDLSLYGAGRPSTPTLDRLARDGVCFTSAYAVSSQCSPSRAGMITGRTPHATGTSRLHSSLTEEHDTVADALRRSGYYVGALQKVHLGEKFQSRWNYYGPNLDSRPFFRDRPRDRPFFLWVGFDDPHRPFETGTISPAQNPAAVRVPGFLPDTAAVRRDLADYYDEISRLDKDVAQILSLLASEGLSQNTMVVFCGDNGMPFPGAKGSLYDHGVHVPLIIRWPGHVPEGLKVATPVSLLDLAPTWLEAAAAGSLRGVEGKSLLPILRDPNAGSSRAVFFERNWHDNLDLIRGVRSGAHLLIQNYRPELPYPPTLDLLSSPTWLSIADLHQKKSLATALEQRYYQTPRTEVELYNVESDPFQLTNLASGDPATVKALQTIMSEWMISTNDFLPPPIPPARGKQGEAIRK